MLPLKSVQLAFTEKRLPLRHKASAPAWPAAGASGVVAGVAATPAERGAGIAAAAAAAGAWLVALAASRPAATGAGAVFIAWSAGAPIEVAPMGPKAVVSPTLA